MIVRVQFFSVFMFHQFLLHKYSHISAKMTLNNTLVTEGFFKIEYMHKLKMVSMLSYFFGWGVQTPHSTNDVPKPQGTNVGLR